MDSCNKESTPQGMPMDKRAGDVGKSESRAVMVRIGVQNLPQPEKVLTSHTGVESRERLRKVLLKRHGRR